jgi:hypothetical protein
MQVLLGDFNVKVKMKFSNLQMGMRACMKLVKPHYCKVLRTENSSFKLHNFELFFFSAVDLHD